MFSHPNMSENTEIIDNDTIDTNEAIGDANENNELPEAISQPENRQMKVKIRQMKVKIRQMKNMITNLI